MGEWKLKCFGVGDGWPGGDRNHSAFLYQFRGASFVLDCGEPLSRMFTASGADCNAFDNIFLSHLHADHLGGLFMFLQGLWLRQRTRPLTVHLPSDGIKPVLALLRASMLFPELFHFKLQFSALKPRKVITAGAGAVRITPFPTTHLEQLRLSFQRRYPLRYEAFCFLFEAAGARAGHSGDIGRPEDLEPLLQRPLDVLVCELAHVAPEALCRYMKGRAIGRVVFVHLGQPFWANLAKTRRIVARTLGGIPATFARDGEELAF